MKRYFLFTCVFLLVSSTSTVNAEEWQLVVTYPGGPGTGPTGPCHAGETCIGPEGIAESRRGIYPHHSLCQDEGERWASEGRRVDTDYWGPDTNGQFTKKTTPKAVRLQQWGYRCELVDTHVPPVDPKDCLVGIGYGDVVTRSVRPGENTRLAPGERAIGLVREDLTPCLESRVLTPGLTGTDSKPEQMYKWKDEKGQWHFSNQPPGSGKR